MNPLFLLLPLAFSPLDPIPIVPPSSTFSDHCASAITMADDLQIQSDWSADSGTCMINVVPRKVADLRYRDLLWAQDGIFMVFNSFGEGPDSQMTGARDYYFFPRLMLPSFRQSAPGTIEIRTASGDLFTFNSNTAELTSLSGGQLEIASSVNPGNRGGIEIPSFHGLLLDSGFMLGGQPEANPDGVSEFRDGFGMKCEVKNSEIFSVSNGSPSLKFTDAQLHEFLLTRCPLLNALDLVHP